MPQKQPNIIFFFTDQQRWDTCGCYGQELLITPNLDKMASEGVRFKHALRANPSADLQEQAFRQVNIQLKLAVIRTIACYQLMNQR